MNEDELIYRLKYGGGSKQPIAKAIKVSNKVHLKVIDATAGLGTDSIVLASLNCQIYAIEKNLTVAELLQKRLDKAKNNDFLAPIVKNITLIIGDSRIIIPDIIKTKQYIPDVIYLDPMFPPKKKTSAPNKQIQILQAIIANSETNTETNDLLKICLNYAKQRIVVKRPRLAANLENIKPHFSLIGRSNRFDVYLPK